MFARGRPCLKSGGSLSTVLDTYAAAGAEEHPLLPLLYPRWFISTVCRRQHHYSRSSIAPKRASSASTNRSNGLGSRSKLPLRRTSFGGSSRRLITTKTSDGAAADTREEVVPSDSTAPVAVSEEHNQEEHKQGEDTTSPGESSGNEGPVVPGTRGKYFDIFAGIRPDTSQPPAEDLPSDHTQIWPGNTTLLGTDRLSVRERRKLRYGAFLSDWTKRGDTPRHHRIHLKKLRDTLEKLQKESLTWPLKNAAKQKELWLPEETVAQMAGVSDMAMKENIWYVTVNNGCKVHVQHPLESQGPHRKVILSGSEQVREIVSDRITHLQTLQKKGDPLVDIRKPLVPVFPSLDALRRNDYPTPVVRGVWDFYSAVTSPAQLTMLLAQMPDLSTIREFAEHVDDMTRAPYNSPNNSQRSSYQKVADALESLFQSEVHHSLISTAALNRALTFLLDHEFLRQARAVCLSALHVITVDTFNILLKHVARRQDGTFFLHFLDVMNQMRIRPNSYTWLALLECVVSPKQKAELFDYILQRGYLTEVGARRTGLHLTIQDSFLLHLESGQSVDSFIHKIMDTQGANWFPPSLIGQMFSVAGRSKNFAAVDRLLDICQEQGFSLSSSIVNQIMLPYRSDIFSALWQLYRCLENPSVKLEKGSYERLFLIAFKGRHFNICRVLWRYACMDGATTHKMKQCVLSSLCFNVGHKKSDFDDAWRTSAGKVIVGIDLHLSDYPMPEWLRAHTPPEFRENPVSYLATGFKHGEDRERQKQLAAALVHRDITVGIWYRSHVPLAISLQAAAVLDAQWKGIPRPTKWLVQNALRVEVRESKFSR